MVSAPPRRNTQTSVCLPASSTAGAVATTSWLSRARRVKEDMFKKQMVLRFSSATLEGWGREDDAQNLGIACQRVHGLQFGVRGAAAGAVGEEPGGGLGRRGILPAL